MEVAYRGALHDLEDWPASYPEYSRIEMGNLRGRFDLAAGGASLEEFGLVGIEALHPFKFNDSLAAEPAWRFDLGLLRDSDQACHRCMRIRGEGGWGYSVLPSPQSLFFGYALINLVSSPEFAGDKILPGIGGVMGGLFGVSRPWVVRVQAKSHQYWFGPQVFEKKEWMLRARWRRDLAWAFEFSMQGTSAVKELELALYHYF
jgi:hypothetical protein